MDNLGSRRKPLQVIEKADIVAKRFRPPEVARSQNQVANLGE